MSDKIVRVGVGVLVLEPDGKVLLGKRKGKLGEGTFSLPGGHLEFGEMLEECARRELKEETGLDGWDFEIVSMTNDIAYDKHFVTIGAVVGKFSGTAQVMETDKFESWDWYDLNDLPEPLFIPSAKFLENFSKDRFY
ncbi:MAG: NUDIX domain-containing protein [Candidatus Pacebacteria bacterium]|jgi:8-oxo-dGTP diphosphatase|nr:NUDIX domain-containing protein [Candidatus Paceibacterota bacterium]